MACVSDERSTFDGQRGMANVNAAAKDGVVANEINVFERYFCATRYVHRGTNFGSCVGCSFSAGKIAAGE